MKGWKLIVLVSITVVFFLFQESDPPAGGPTLVGDEAISMNARSATQSGTQNPDRQVMGFL